jgi:hypothetical protein
MLFQENRKTTNTKQRQAHVLRLESEAKDLDEGDWNIIHASNSLSLGYLWSNLNKSKIFFSHFKKKCKNIMLYINY